MTEGTEQISRPIIMSAVASEAIEKLMDSRGAILLAFAQVEWFLAKLVVEAASFEQYATLDLSFSQDAEKRADRLKAILKIDGPFSPYAGDLIKAVDKVLEHVPLRTMAAHGLIVRTDPQDFSISSKLHLRMYRMYKGGALKEETVNLTLKEYTDQSAALTGAARAFVAIVRKIWKDLDFKNLDPD